MKKASVVIPTYNQIDSLQNVLQFFSMQTVDKNLYEIIIIDDGSTDELSNMNATTMQKKYDMNIELIHQKNSGRAVSRNNGAKASTGDIIIFCDSDRVPNKNYISQYLEEHQSKDIVVGSPLDYFGKSADLITMDYEKIRKLSRQPIYFRNVKVLFNKDGQTDSKLAWLGFLVGNSSVKRDVFKEVGGFSEEFTDWGFEHFEIAYRFMERSYKIFLCESIESYHLAHPRAKGFYEEKIKASIDLIVRMHPKINKEILNKIFLESKYSFEKIEEVL